MNDLLTAGLSVVKACEYAGQSRRSFYYRPRARTSRPVDPIVRELVHEYAEKRPSFGYRRIAAMIRREYSIPLNEKKVLRIERLDGLTLPPNKPDPRRRRVSRKGSQLAPVPDMWWSGDITYIWCGRDGWAYLYNIVDCCTMEWIAYVFSPLCRAEEGRECLGKAVLSRFPETGKANGVILWMDNGSQFGARIFIEATKLLGVEVKRSAYDTPEDNGVVESFHSSFKRDYVWTQEFGSFQEAESHIARAFPDYNTVKPQERLGWKTPAEYKMEVKESVASRAPKTVQN